MRNVEWLASLASEDIAKLFEEGDGRCSVCKWGPGNNGGVHLCGAMNCECDDSVLSWLTSERVEPDTQEMIDADAGKGAFAYWGCRLSDCAECPSEIEGKTPDKRYGVVSCVHAYALDLLRRQRELDARLAEGGAGE